MKERLVELLLSKSCCNNDCDDELQCENCDCIAVATGDAEKIADYLLANGVIVPPFDIGDTLYDVSEFVNEIPYPEMYELQADYISIKKDENGEYYFEYDCIDIYPKDMGKTIFLTKEEAEQKLKERKEDEGK